MGLVLWLGVGLLLVFVQAWASTPEKQKCVPGFKKDSNLFQVDRRHLHSGHVLGKVGFEDCMANKRFKFGSSDRHFHVEQDGTLMVTRETTMLGRKRAFLISSLNSKGQKFSTIIRVQLHGNGHHHPGSHPMKIQAHQNPGKELQKSANVDPSNKTEVIQNLPVLHLLKFSRRRKRAWVIPPLNILENDRGPYPKLVAQIRSDKDKESRMEYKITGDGINGLFTIDKNTGQLYVTQPLDREKRSDYRFNASANVAGMVNAAAEAAMLIIVNVLDANDNKPVFTQDPYVGEVAEASAKDFEVITIKADDLDDPNSDNSLVHYKILSQEPKLPNDNLFDINPVSGVIRVKQQGLDREKYPKYTLEVEAADMKGDGLTVTGHVHLTVTDSNDNAPVFEMAQYNANVPENKVGAQVVRMSVTDGDEHNSPAWNAKFKIVAGDKNGQFAVETGTGKQEGIITTVKGLDYEMTKTYTLLVTVENEIPFAIRLPTATATVVVSVGDVNEAPVFSPPIQVVKRKEDLAVASDIVTYTATDPDTERSQKVTYKIMKDPARWLSVNPDTGLIKVKNGMDRESQYVQDGKYTALIMAYDDDVSPATGTGTLEIELEDVNDNIPSINERIIKVCNKDSAPQLLSVTDADGPDFAAPYTVSLMGMSKNNWTATMDGTRTGIILTLIRDLPKGDYNVVLRVADNHGLDQDNIVMATVCDCTGNEVTCKGGIREGAIGLPVILGILGAVLLLLLLVLLLLIFIRRRGGEQKEPLLPNEDIRDNIYYYDEEGGGEDDQDYYDLSVLHRGLDNRPEVFRNDVMPCFMPKAEYRPRPANPEDIGKFIDDNLTAADNDPLAPPYDSLLVFDDEGKGSDAGSLSSLNSSSSGDQDYDCLGEWGPRFKKLADMYGGGEDDML
ncbi:B-cadherin [Gadus morhua]|uniref:Cadherin-1 n=1 Tax=Gadus morhua TaxID=8049 RepID=A0A8C5CXZ8_GADMO|nr:B-cadherin-like [Gadus morhua]